MTPKIKILSFVILSIQNILCETAINKTIHIGPTLQRTLFKADDTLVLSNVIFRHGDRYPEPAHFYSNDPNKNRSVFPYKFGELTRTGQTRMFMIGKQLKLRYANFLGDTYYTDLVESTTSDYPRTQMSLQSLHAGLFLTMKPNTIPGFLWKPVPYRIIPWSEDKYLAAYKPCLAILLNLTYPPIPPDVQDLFNYVKMHTGVSQISYHEMWVLADYAKTMIETNIPIPEWHKKIYPNPLAPLSAKYLDMLRIQKRRIGGAYLVKRISDDALAKRDNTLVPPNRKLFLYSAHDFTILFLRSALNIWTAEPCEYGAYVLLELHKIGPEYGFKVYFNNGYTKPQLQTIPGCGTFCPLDEFIQMFRHLYEPPPICK